VLSIEPREKAVKRHLASLRSLWKENKGRNNVVCQQTVDNNLLQKLYESPEFLRYQLVGRSVVDLLVEKSRDDIGKYFGYLFSCGMTTFLRLPEAQIFSLMMSTFFGALPADAASSPRFELTKHPLPAFESLEARLFSTLLKAPTGGTTKVLVRRLPGASVPLLRVDLVKMTRPVNHHFDYARDGHKRKYIMHLARNDSVLVDPLNAAPWEHAKGLQQRIAGNPWTGASGLPLGFHHNAGGMVGLYLTRDHALTGASRNRYIPYMVIRAITLIAVLRLGLVAELKDHAYRDFVKLPLYEDMAPWNIVFQGGTLDYIDYDTKDKTFSKVVPLAYQVMSVLMNYKRTVEDFGKCGTKAGNPYNFPFVSDCVRSRDYSHPSPKCEDPKEPVACSDGHCRSDYISCLKAIVKMEEKRGSPEEVKVHQAERHKTLEAKLLHDGVFEFDTSGVVEPAEKVVE